MSIITQKQVLELEANSTFKDVSKQFVRDRSTYLMNQDGTVGNLAGLTPANWARQRFIAAGISLHPNSQDYNEWASQFSMLLKGQDVWDTDAATTIDAMIASGKFEELAGLSYVLRATRIEF
jgi:hypothetical protein